MSTEFVNDPAAEGTYGARAAEAPGGGERQVVALHLGDEVYGVDIACIHTVITPQAITSVPRAPDYVRGVMNLRGRILPVLDLRTRFGLPPRPDANAKSSRIVIVDAQGLTAGLIVDAVSEVLRLPETCIDPPSRLVATPDAGCVTGIGRIQRSRREGDDPQGDSLILLLDAHQVLSAGPHDDLLQTLQKAA